MSLSIGIEAAKRSFFDKKKVADAMDRGERAALSRIGAFVRTRAQRSMRRRKKASDPGSPPSAHVGYLRKFLFFVWDAARRSVVVGPALLNGVRRGPGGLTVPETLEYGGPVAVTEYQLSGGRWVGGGNPLVRGKTRGRPTRTRTGYVEARPTMGPALAAELPRLADLYRDCVRG